jgi:CRISPR/Cas system-associated protein Csm6
MATKQYVLRLDEEFISRLSEAARRFGVSSGNQVAIEVLNHYLEFWVAAKEGQHAVLQQQRTALSTQAEAVKASPKSKPSSRRK